MEPEKSFGGFRVHAAGFCCNSFRALAIRSENCSTVIPKKAAASRALKRSR